MKIDLHKLQGIIEKEACDITNSPFIDTSFCFGEINGMQFQVKITKDEGDFFDDILDIDNCIED